MYSDTLIMKFGGASVSTPEHFPRIATLIAEKKKRHSRLAVVVSAMGQTTDQLIALAHKVHASPPQREYDMLISAGERISMALLAMALCQKGCEARSFTGSQSGILTCSQHSNAKIIDVRPHRLSESLDRGEIVIVAGFQGVSQEKEITTLGRGGSDTTAVALGVALGAGRVEFYKDVPGVFDHDPKIHPEAEQYAILNYQEALDIMLNGAKVLHPRAIQLAAHNALPLYVRSFQVGVDENGGTWIKDPALSISSKPVYENA